MYLFSKKIKCSKCNKNYRGIQERGKIKYICSGYTNYKLCERNILEEEKLLSLIVNHLEIQNVKMGIGLRKNRSRSKIGEKRIEEMISLEVVTKYVKDIIADPVNQNLIIHYQDGTETFISATLLKF